MFRPLTLVAAAAGTLLLAACQETGTESPLEPRSLATGNASEAKQLASLCAPNRGLERTWPNRIDVVQRHAGAGRSDAAADVAARLIADITGLYDCSDSDLAELVVLILQIAGLVPSDPDPESQALIAQALAAGDAGFVAPIDLSTGGEATSENQCGGVSIPIQPGGGTILVVGFEVDGDPDPFAPFGYQSFRHRYRFETIPAGFEFDVPALAAVELIEAGLGEVDLEDILYARLRNEIVEILGEDVGTRDDAGAEALLACTDIAVALSGWQGWAARALTPATKVLGIDPLFASPAGLGARVSAFSIYAGVVPTDGDGDPEPPPPGTDIIVFNDINVFDNDRLVDDNVTLLANLLNFTTDGSRGEGSTVWVDCRNVANKEFFPNNLVDGCEHPEFESFRATIANQGFSFVGITEGSLTEIPADVKVIFLWIPDVAYSAAEVNALKQFASEGGRVVFVGEWDGFYGAFFSVQNSFLLAMGAEMQNIGGNFVCPATIPSSAIRPHQVTQGVDQFLMGCSSEITLGENDFPLILSPTEEQILAGVAAIDTTPIVVVESSAVHSLVPDAAPVGPQPPAMR
jgi:hypothetical protein